MGLKDVFEVFCSLVSLSMKGKVCINNEINHVVSCIDIVAIAEPINTIISRKHSIEHEILKIGQVLSGKEVFSIIHITGTL